MASSASEGLLSSLNLLVSKFRILSSRESEKFDWKSVQIYSVLEFE